MSVTEASAKVQFSMDEQGLPWPIVSEELDAAELRKVIVKLVHVLSYISDDPNGALKRFNVDYGDTE